MLLSAGRPWEGRKLLVRNRLLGYDAQALTITAVRHAFIVIADLLAATSIAGLIATLIILFHGTHAGATADTERRRP
jgi:hypothetical protein